MGRWFFSFGIVLALCVAVIAAPKVVRQWSGSSGADRGVGILRIDPTPPARAIWIDGKPMETGSPAMMEGIASGLHHVRLDLGLFGTIEEEVRLRDGETLDLAPQAAGAIEIDALVPRTDARAWIQGSEPRTVPCRFDSVPVGWQNLFYEDSELPLWQRELFVRAGRTQNVRVGNAIAAGHSLLRIEPLQYRSGEGLVEAVDDSVRVDGIVVGLTPWEEEVAPGLHGVWVRSSTGQVWTEVVDLAAGATRIVVPRFGMEDWPRILHTEPGRVVLGGQLLLTATIQMPDRSNPKNPRLHFPNLGGSLRDLPMTPIDSAEGVFVGVVAPGAIPEGRPIAYYFTVQTASGSTLCSELYHLTAVTDISLLDP